LQVSGAELPQETPGKFTARVRTGFETWRNAARAAGL